MNTLRFMPEGWNNEITKLDINNVNQYIQTGDTLQGLVKECDEKYNLHVKFENGLTGIMPREEIEAIIKEDVTTMKDMMKLSTERRKYFDKWGEAYEYEF